MLPLLASLALAGPQLNDPERPYALQLDAELGFLAPVAHTLQFSKQGSRLDYVREGGQDNLFPTARLGATLHWRRQAFTLLWQPLSIDTVATLDRDLRVDDVIFEAGEPIAMQYGFPFWRASWGHRVVEGPTEVTLGLGLQIRNATIGFTAVDGSRSEVNRDIGPVPLLEAGFARRFDDGGFVELEADGFYAPIRYLNGRDVDVIGAILDTQVRLGLDLADPYAAWVGLRYIGGGGEGTGTVDGTGDGFTRNWLHFVTASVGVRVR